ncbi:MAG TPA: hypothetical protein VLH79_03055 [Chthonomonadales bacterium]|nr:hypothetical protein [Chthonomonadales bacterium]
MPAPITPDEPRPLPRPPRTGRELRRALADAWDALGLVCGVSLTVFAVIALPPASAVASQHPLLVGAAVVWVFLVGGPLWFGTCHVAHLIASRDEPNYAALWSAARRHWKQAVALALVQGIISLVLLADIVFFVTRAFPGAALVAALFGYALLFWWMNCLYHWPLLVAAHAGIIARDGGAPPRLRSVLKNALVMAVSAPGFTSIFLLATMVTFALLAATGVGLAMLGAGLVAIVTTTAGRAQLVRFGALPEPPNTDGPAVDQGWRMR